jgi:5-methylcytosine-specific restriction enzyme subunit McrC
MEVRRDVTVVECAEYQTIDVDPNLWLGDAHQTIFNSEIDGQDVLRANFKNGVLRLQATSYVGVIPINEHVVVRVRPRVPIANLTRMVVDTGQSVLALSAFRDYSGRGTADDWAMDIYTNALLDYVDELLDLGFLRAYERREDEGHVPHGRLDFNRTLQRFAARGIPNKAAYSWHERTIDTPANRCVKAALEVVHAHLSKTRAKPRKGDRAKLARLAGHLRAFEEVSEDLDYRFLDDPQVLGFLPLPDPRAYYRQMLDLSVLILSGVGIAIDLGGDDVQLASLLIDTNKLFENFVRVSLSKHAAKHGLALEVLDGNAEGRVPLYDVPAELPAPFGSPLPALASSDPGMAQPDIVFRALDGRFTLVAEVKNTVHGMSADAFEVLPERPEVHQAVTYALRYGLTLALLIHPWTKGQRGLVYIGRVRSVDVYDFRLDLSSDEHLDDRLSEMAMTLVGLSGVSVADAIPA